MIGWLRGRLGRAHGTPALCHPDAAGRHHVPGGGQRDDRRLAELCQGGIAKADLLLYMQRGLIIVGMVFVVMSIL